MAFRREKLGNLALALDQLHKRGITYKTPALADRITSMIQPLALGERTLKEYVRILVDALAWEQKHEGEKFVFATY